MCDNTYLIHIMLNYKKITQQIGVHTGDIYKLYVKKFPIVANWLFIR